VTTPLIPLGFRVDRALKAALEKAAADDERPLSSLVVKILREWLRPRGYLGPPAPPPVPSTAPTAPKKPRKRASPRKDKA
jgi:hypothetical protein